MVSVNNKQQQHKGRIKIKTAFYVFVSMAYTSYFPNKHPISSGSVFNVLFWGPKHQEDTPILSLFLCPTSPFLHFSHFCLNVAYSLVTFPFPLFFHFFSILFIVHVLCTTHPLYPSLPLYLSKSVTIYLLMQVWCLENCWRKCCLIWNKQITLI